MYKTLVPIHINTLNEETFPIYLETVKKCKAERVFICGVSAYNEKDVHNVIFKNPQKLKNAVKFFKDNGLETGIWVDGFGHGVALSHEKGENLEKYIQLEGIRGDKFSYGNCPMDENFANDFKAGIRKIAECKPDIIMLDDDFRINGRRYYMGCFCPNHLKEYYKRIGEEIPREKLEELIFTGGKNKYRTEYMKLMADTIKNFAKMLRRTVDEVDKTIRLGSCMTGENWDFAGSDGIEISKTFAGETKPFLRTAGAPYCEKDIIGVVEDTRLQISWCEGKGVEVFSEGDVYPRPRYNVPSKKLELFDFALIADGTADGILKYMFDYVQKPDYETGYTDIHIKNEPLRNQIREIFSDKKPVGVRSYNVMHKIENWDFYDKKPENFVDMLIWNVFKSASRNILSKNSIPTSYNKGEYPVMICGENARYISEKDLENGALIDINAAKILKERGIDTGLISMEDCSVISERFIKENDEIFNISGAFKKIKCNEKAEVLSVFTPSETPSAYLYENEKGMRFYVFAWDMYFASENTNLTNNYYRQSQLIEAIEWCGKKKLPAVCRKNPNLYILASSDGEAMSVILINDFMDEILNPVIEVDLNYSEIKFVNCTGKLEKNKVYLSEIAPYGFAAFEVKKG